MVTLLLVFSAALGLAAGSFCNVLIHRLPRGESIVSPPSHCPECGGEIPWFCNVPLLSWLLLGGRCASCRSRISARYPLVELLVGVLFFLSFWRWGLTVETAAAWVFCLWMVALALIDLEHQILPDLLTIPGIALGMGFSFFLLWTDWRGSLAGALAGAGLPALLIGLYALGGVEAMGWGDVKLLAMVGAFLGWKGLVLTLLMGTLSGSLIGGAYLWVSGKGRQTPLPFGTFLGASAIASLFLQEPAWRWYAGMVAFPLAAVRAALGIPAG